MPTAKNKLISFADSPEGAVRKISDRPCYGFASQAGPGIRWRHSSLFRALSLMCKSK